MRVRRRHADKGSNILGIDLSYRSSGEIESSVISGIRHIFSFR